MRMLERSFKVTTRYGGGFVESIDGHTGGSRTSTGSTTSTGSRRPRAPPHRGPPGRPDLVGPARLERDRHDPGGRRLLPRAVHQRHRRQAFPVTLECATDAAPPASGSTRAQRDRRPGREPGARRGSGTDSLGVVVGTWSEVKGDIAAELIEQGPARAASTPSSPARRATLELLEPARAGRAHARADAGLIAATAQASRPTWLVTGTDTAGRDARPRALTPARLRTTSRSPSGRHRHPGSARGRVMTYRRRASPLHAARAGAGARTAWRSRSPRCYCPSPVVLGAVASRSRSPASRRRRARAAPRRLWAVPLGARHGRQRAGGRRRADRDRAPRRPAAARPDRHHARGDRLRRGARPAGGRAGPVRALYTVAVDPDEVLRLFRRVSFRSALSATLATRMVPVLVRDSRRLAEAQRCRPGPPPSRAQLLRATTAGVLDRALDVAAALEVRGYGAARRPRGRRVRARGRATTSRSRRRGRARRAGGRCARRRPGAVQRVSVAARAGRRPASVAVALAIVVCALAPFADRRGIER